MTETSSYPFDEVDLDVDAGPPEDPTEEEIAEGRRIVDELRRRAEAQRQPRGAVSWRLAGCLEVLRAEANAYNPTRDRGSDGTIGDAAHASRVSDHNPNAAGVVRALDLDIDGLPLAAAFERIRVSAVTGWLPQLRNGGYLILNRRITAPDWTHWNPYTGINPHTAHGHTSASVDAPSYDRRGPFQAFGPDPTPTPPPPPAGPGWVGPDLVGTGTGLRGTRGNNGARVAGLQDQLRTRFPLYAKGLTVDGWWGGQTTAVLAEFARRSGIVGADGATIGPQIAAALVRGGIRP